MGLTPSQGELGVALRPKFANIKGVHDQVIKECMDAVNTAGLTLNSPNCVFGKR